MEGLGGYCEDLIRELKKIKNIFGGGVIAIPGVPILLGGCNSSELIRDLWDMVGWLQHIGKLELCRAWVGALGGLIGKGGTPDFQSDRKNRIRVPENLDSYATRSWVSPGGATLLREAPPASPTQERATINGLIYDLNARYALNLGRSIDLKRRTDSVDVQKGKIMMIGGSHAIRTADELEYRGHDVVRVCKSGFRAIKPTVASLLPKVREGLLKMGPTDPVIIQCLDNTAYLGRSEEGGDLPVRKIPTGAYHIDRDLVVATYKRQKMMFETVEPILQLAKDRPAILVTHMPRWLYRGCCQDEEHAPNRNEEGFEDNLMRDLKNFKTSFKNLCFTRNLRLRVIDPSPRLTAQRGWRRNLGRRSRASP
jgi:hypothetical protein